MIDPKQSLLSLRRQRRRSVEPHDVAPTEADSADLSDEVIAALRARSIHSVEEVLALHWLDQQYGHRFVESFGLTADDIRGLEEALRLIPGSNADRESWQDWGRREYILGYDFELEEHEQPFEVERTGAGPADLAPSMSGSVSLIADMPSVRHQGRRNSCVAFVAAACLEHYIGRTRRVAADLSEQFILWNLLSQTGDLTLGSVFPLLVAAGSCREATWPYRPVEDPNDPAQGPPPPEAPTEAWNFRCGTVQAITNMAGIRQCLTQGLPVGIGVLAYASWWNNPVVRRYGNIGMPQEGEVPLALGHALTLVGFTSHPEYPGGGFFLVRNSFGRDWGAENPIAVGHGTIPYAYVQYYTQRAAWCIAA